MPSEPMTQERLEQIKARVKAADLENPGDPLRITIGRKNFIFHARQDIPDLVAEVERLREALKPFALLEFETTQDAWEAFFRAQGRTWVSYEDIDAARRYITGATNDQ